MGLNASESKIWLKVKEGRFYKTSDKDNTQPYNSLSGTIVNMYFKEETWNQKKVQKLAVTVKSGEDLYEFTMTVDSSSCSKFLNFLSNTDVTKEVVIVPKYSVGADGSKDYSMLVGQNEVFKPKYTKANPGALPPLEKTTFKGEERWDNTKQLAFWKEYIKSLDFGKHDSHPNITSEPTAHAPEQEEDELPF